jgi:hypothetical protein
MIGFLAKKRRGKDTSADYLCDEHGYVKRAFAGPLKKAVQELFGFTDSQLHTEQKELVDERWGVSPRKALQVVGSDMIRDLFPKLLLPDIGNDFWTKRVDIWYNETKNDHKGLVIISDVRFQNEVDYIHSKGGVVIKINRPDLDSKIIDLHQSEISVDKIENYDLILNNNGKKEDLYEKIDKIMKFIKNNNYFL